MTVKRTSLWALAGLLSLTLSLPLMGCNDLPEEAYVEYPRMLGLRASVVSSPLRSIDPQDPRPFAQALPFETVQLSEWVVSPQGPAAQGGLGGRWLACERLPQTGPGDCLRGYIRDKDPILNEIGPCQTSDVGLPGRQPGADNSASLPTRTPPCYLPANQNPPQYTVPLSVNMLLGASFEFWFFVSLPNGGPGTEICIRDLLQGKHELNDNCLYGVTSLSIGPRALLENLIEAAGIDPDKLDPSNPQNPGDKGPQGPQKPEAPVPEGNRHPRIAQASYTIEVDGAPVNAGQLIEPGEVITAPLDSTVRLEIVLPASELQSFPVEVNDGEDFELRTEEYESDWFYSWGSLEASNDREEVAIERWTLSPNADQTQPAKNPGDEVFAFFTVRDERGGMTWRSFKVKLSPSISQSGAPQLTSSAP